MPWGKLIAAVPLPPGGYRVFRVGTEPLEKATGNMSSEQFVARPISLPAAGKRARIKGAALASLRTPQGDEMLRAPVRLVVCRDLSDAWGQNTDRYREELGYAKIVSTEIIEDGPHLTITRQYMTWRKSEIHLDVIRYGHTPQLGIKIRLNWQEKRQIAKLEIDTRLRGTTVHAKMAGEVARRPADGNENPCHDWVAVEGKTGREAGHRRPAQPIQLQL